MAHAEAGILPDKPPRVIEIPAELEAALASAFAALTPGRQRSHILHLEGTANSATRHRRIEKLRPKIMAGKGFNER
jgi:uncharacterized protein YdeI (YjbR/CyaY-like superfamily)